MNSTHYGVLFEVLHIARLGAPRVSPEESRALRDVMSDVYYIFDVSTGTVTFEGDYNDRRAAEIRELLGRLLKTSRPLPKPSRVFYRDPNDMTNDFEAFLDAEKRIRWSMMSEGGSRSQVLYGPIFKAIYIGWCMPGAHYL